MFLIGRCSSVRDADVILRFSSSVPDKADVILLVPVRVFLIKQTLYFSCSSVPDKADVILLVPVRVLLIKQTLYC